MLTPILTDDPAVRALALEGGLLWLWAALGLSMAARLAGNLTRYAGGG